MKTDEQLEEEFAKFLATNRTKIAQQLSPEQGLRMAFFAGAMYGCDLAKEILITPSQS